MDREPETVRIQLLGGFRVTTWPRTLGEEGWRPKKARSLVKLLALVPYHRLHVEAFEEAAWMTRRHREPATYRAAIDLYAGDPLPHGRYEAWAEDRREGLRPTALDLLSGIGKLYARGVQAKQRFLLTDRKVER